MSSRLSLLISHLNFDTLVFIIKDDYQLQRCYVADILPRSTATTYPCWRSRLIGCYIILSVGDDIIVDKQSADAALSRHLVDASSSSHPYHIVPIVFASDKGFLRQDDTSHEPSPIQLDPICHISNIIETGKEFKYQATIDMDWIGYFDNLVNSSNASSPPITDNAAIPVKGSLQGHPDSGEIW
jgi:hypothetical protein